MKDKIVQRSFLKLSFANKCLTAINLGNVPHHKLIKSQIPPCFKDQSISIIFNTYTKPVATEIFSYKELLQDLNIDASKSKSPDCTCTSSPFIYNPAGHVTTGDLNIINNTSLGDVFAKGPKYREPRSINWKHNFNSDYLFGILKLFFLKFLWIPLRIMPDNEQKEKSKTKILIPNG